MSFAFFKALLGSFSKVRKGIKRWTKTEYNKSAYHYKEIRQFWAAIMQKRGK